MKGSSIQFNTLRYSLIRFDTLRYVSIHFDTLGYVTIHFDTFRYTLIHLGVAACCTFASLLLRKKQSGPRKKGEARLVAPKVSGDSR